MNKWVDMPERGWRDRRPSRAGRALGGLVAVLAVVVVVSLLVWGLVAIWRAIGGVS